MKINYFSLSLMIILLLTVSSCKEKEAIMLPVYAEEAIGLQKLTAEEAIGFKNYTELKLEPPTSTARLSFESSKVKFKDEAILWHKAVKHIQKDSNKQMMTVPTLKFKGNNKIELEHIYFMTNGGDTSLIRVRVEPVGKFEGKGFTGKIIVKSLDEKKKNEYFLKENKNVKNLRVTKTNDGIDLPEVIVTASRPLPNIVTQFNFAWGEFSSYSSSVNEMVDSSSGSGWSSISESDLKRQFLQAISDELASMGLGGLNEQEINLLLTWSWDDIAAFGRNVLFAQADTKLFYGTYTSDGDKANAFKHAYLAALHYYSFGSNKAGQILNAHENFRCGQQGLNCLDNMDCLNNAAGINIASSQPNILSAIAVILTQANTGALTTCN